MIHEILQEVADRAIDKFKSAVEVINELPGCEGLKRVCRTILTTQTDVTQNLLAAFKKQNKIMMDWNLMISKEYLIAGPAPLPLSMNMKMLVSQTIPHCLDSFISIEKMKDREEDIPLLKQVIIREVRIRLRTHDGFPTTHEDGESSLMKHIQREVDRYCMMKMDL